MRIVTKLDEYKEVFIAVSTCIYNDPIGEKFDESYKNLLKFLISNIPENRDDIVMLFSKNIDCYNKEMSVPLDSATERERAFYNAGRFSGLCELIKNFGDYNKTLEKFLRPYFDLEVGDTVYVVINDILYKTTVAQKKENKIQVNYGRRWFTQDDYLEYIFPYAEKENLHKSGRLASHSNCDKCSGFKQGKCAYGYSLGTYSGVILTSVKIFQFLHGAGCIIGQPVPCRKENLIVREYTYRFDNTKYKVIKGRPTEICCKTIKK